MKQRCTRQLEAVYEAVRAAEDHPTADEIYSRVRRRLPRVSLGTVYRNLQKLTAQQRVRVVQRADRVARYDAMLADHDHFLCESCGGLTDVFPARRGQPGRADLGQVGYTVLRQSVTLYGLCPQCNSVKRGHEAAF